MGMSMNFWFLSAAILSTGICALHVFGGGRQAARPLLATTELDHVAKFTNYYCWHLVTIAIALMAAAFAFASRPEANADPAIFASATAVTFALWSIVMIVRYRLSPLQFGQWALFLPAGLLGAVGLAI
jgi:uncharacterized membrane protein YjjP (DUF1212 family)